MSSINLYGKELNKMEFLLNLFVFHLICSFLSSIGLSFCFSRNTNAIIIQIPFIVFSFSYFLFLLFLFLFLDLIILPSKSILLLSLLSLFFFFFFSYVQYVSFCLGKAYVKYSSAGGRFNVCKAYALKLCSSA